MRLRTLLVSADGSVNEVRKLNTYGMVYGAGRVKRYKNLDLREAMYECCKPLIA